MDNITALCTTQCGSSLSSWLATVESACAGDNVTQSSVQVQAKAMTLQFTYNYDLACLRNRYSVPGLNSKLNVLTTMQRGRLVLLRQPGLAGK
jgi:hypothetical protein